MNQREQRRVGQILMGAVAVFGVWAAFAIPDLINQPPPRADHCLSEITESAKVVLVDVSDPLSDRQKQDQQTWFAKSVLSDLRFNERLQLYALNGHLRSLPQPILSECRPQLKSSEHETHASDAYLLAQAEGWDKKWKNAFGAALAKASPAPQSPIVEYLTEAMRDKPMAAARQRQIYLASDLLQNSPTTSWGNIEGDLFANTSVEIIQIGRQKTWRKKQKEMAEWFKRFFQEHGTSSVKFGPWLEP